MTDDRSAMPSEVPYITGPNKWRWRDRFGNIMRPGSYTDIDVARSPLRNVLYAEGGNLAPPLVESTKPKKCRVCASTDIRPDQHELDPGWRCYPKGHVQ